MAMLGIWDHNIFVITVGCRVIEHLEVRGTWQLLILGRRTTPYKAIWVFL